MSDTSSSYSSDESSGCETSSYETSSYETSSYETSSDETSESSGCETSSYSGSELSDSDESSNCSDSSNGNESIDSNSPRIYNEDPEIDFKFDPVKHVRIQGDVILTNHPYGQHRTYFEHGYYEKVKNKLGTSIMIYNFKDELLIAHIFAYSPPHVVSSKEYIILTVDCQIMIYKRRTLKKLPAKKIVKSNNSVKCCCRIDIIASAPMTRRFAHDKYICAIVKDQYGEFIYAMDQVHASRNIILKYDLAGRLIEIKYVGFPHMMLKYRDTLILYSVAVPDDDDDDDDEIFIRIKNAEDELPATEYFEYAGDTNEKKVGQYPGCVRDIGSNLSVTCTCECWDDRKCTCAHIIIRLPDRKIADKNQPIGFPRIYTKENIVFVSDRMVFTQAKKGCVIKRYVFRPVDDDPY